MAAARRRPRSRDARTGDAGRWLLALGGLLVAIGWTGLAVVDAATRTRTLFQDLSEVQRAQDRLLEEQSRLSLELGTISSLQEIEEIAVHELGMEFPEHLAQVQP